VGLPPRYPRRDAVTVDHLTQSSSFQRWSSLILTKHYVANTQTKYNSKGNNATQSKTKLNWLSCLLRHVDTRPGNEMDSFYNAPETTQGD